MTQFSLSLGTGVGEERNEDVAVTTASLDGLARRAYHAERLTCAICAEVANHRGHPVRHTSHRETPPWAPTKRPQEWAKKAKRQREKAETLGVLRRGSGGQAPG